MPCYLPLTLHNLDRSPFPNATELGEVIAKYVGRQNCAAIAYILIRCQWHRFPSTQCLSITSCALETGWTYSDNEYQTQARRRVKPLPIFGATRTAHYPPGGHTLHMRKRAGGREEELLAHAICTCESSSQHDDARAGHGCG